MAQSVYGWQGKILRANLTTKRDQRRAPLRGAAAAAISVATGINARLLLRGLKNKITVPTPLSPDNPLIFGFAILAGTSFPCSSRFTVTAKSPVTGIFGDSNAGGSCP